MISNKIQDSRSTEKRETRTCRMCLLNFVKIYELSVFTGGGIDMRYFVKSKFLRSLVDKKTLGLMRSNFQVTILSQGS